MLETLKNAFKTKEIRIKIFLTLAMLLVYRIGCYIPLPGLSASAIEGNFASNEFLGVLSTLTGGSMQNGTLFALGILPFINAFIIMQLLTLAHYNAAFDSRYPGSRKTFKRRGIGQKKADANHEILRNRIGNHSGYRYIVCLEERNYPHLLF